MSDIETIKAARERILALANGVNYHTGELLDEDSVL